MAFLFKKKDGSSTDLHRDCLQPQSQSHTLDDTMMAHSSIGPNIQNLHIGQPVPHSNHPTLSDSIMPQHSMPLAMPIPMAVPMPMPVSAMPTQYQQPMIHAPQPLMPHPQAYSHSHYDQSPHHHQHQQHHSQQQQQQQQNASLSTSSTHSSPIQTPNTYSTPSSPMSDSRELSHEPPHPLPVIEDRPSDDVIILRTHFHQIPNIGRRTFNIGDTLGTGTFGRVRLVTYFNPDLAPKLLHFALKMLKKSEILRLKQVEHIKAEKSILSQICHPFIVNLFAHFQDERCLYMLMEYVIGGELFSQLRKVGRFSNDTARFYAAEIVLALQYLHNKDIVYRDLKPENLLIDREGHIKITDFGFAKIVTDRTWTLCGTPEYLAPEIIQSKGHGKSVDWWALGILIYEMIAGYPPFYDDNQFQIYSKILAGKIEFPKHFDPYAKDLVKKLLTADRSKRFGCLKDGADDVKRHRWFKGVDWIRVHCRRVKPPYVPGFASPGDTSNFDRYPDSDDESEQTLIAQKDRELFNDF